MRKMNVFGHASAGVSLISAVLTQKSKTHVEVVTKLPPMKYLAFDKIPELMESPLVFDKPKSKFHK